jgi:hypothetical protein
MVGVRGFEPPTSWSQTMRASRCATPRINLYPTILNHILSSPSLLPPIEALLLIDGRNESDVQSHPIKVCSFGIEWWRKGRIAGIGKN